MSDPARAFRDYATRVSFNLSLSRNQLGHLVGIVTEIEAYRANSKLGWLSRVDLRDAAVDAAGGRSNMFVVGRGSLQRMGLIEDDSRFAERERLKKLGKPHGNYDGPRFQLTPAGERVVALLRLAGLMAPAAANDRRAKKRRRA